MKQITKIFFIIIFIAMTSCATSLSDMGTKEIEITTVPSDAYVYVDGWIVKTPAKVKLKDNRSHVIKVKKDGYKYKEVKPETSIKYGDVFGRNVIWSFGYPVAILVDFSTGGAFGVSDTKIILEEVK